jgi:hypothetical protein
VSSLDGSKLYLKAVQEQELQNLDSCDVIHGKFKFSGTLDSVSFVSLFMGDESIMPLVLEEGEIEVRIDGASQKVSGTPLNDELYQFIDLHNQLDNQLSDLSHRQSQMMLDGIDENQINRQLNAEADLIAAEEDRLVTKFICDNFDNVLGPGVFMMITSQYRYPILTPQIEDIMSKATEKFKSDPYVREYYQAAQENEARMNGTKDMDDADVAPLPDSTAVQPAAPLTNVPQP